MRTAGLIRCGQRIVDTDVGKAHNFYMIDWDSRVPHIEGQIAAVKDGQVVGNAAAAYAAIGALRAQADKYERDLIRALRWDKDGEVLRKWADVAALVDAQLGSRQAAHQRWRRLLSPDRRTTSGDYRRGAARLGRTTDT